MYNLQVSVPSDFVILFQWLGTLNLAIKSNRCVCTISMGDNSLIVCKWALTPEHGLNTWFNYTLIKCTLAVSCFRPCSVGCFLTFMRKFTHAEAYNTLYLCREYLLFKLCGIFSHLCIRLSIITRNSDFLHFKFYAKKNPW